MQYMIDGHNLIGQLRDIDLNDPNDEALLVQQLTGFTARTRHKVVVVFDYGLPGGKSRMSTRAVQVVFASQRSTADRVMLERMKKIKNPRDWVIVSSDNDVLSTARVRKMQILRSPDFAELMKAPPPPIIDAGEEANVSLSEEEVDEWMNFFDTDAG